MEQTLELRVSLKQLRQQRRELLIRMTTAIKKVNGALNGDTEKKKKEK